MYGDGRGDADRVGGQFEAVVGANTNVSVHSGYQYPSSIRLTIPASAPQL